MITLEDKLDEAVRRGEMRLQREAEDGFIDEEDEDSGDKDDEDNL